MKRDGFRWVIRVSFLGILIFVGFLGGIQALNRDTGLSFSASAREKPGTLTRAGTGTGFSLEYASMMHWVDDRAIHGITKRVAMHNNARSGVFLSNTSITINGFINIRGDVDLEQFILNYGLPGNGSASNPFVIEHVSAEGIVLINTTKSVVIQHNEFDLYEYNPYNRSIFFLQNTSNVVIQYNMLETSKTQVIGYAIWCSQNIIVRNNTLNGIPRGVMAEYSENILITGNKFMDLYSVGVEFRRCMNVTVRDLIMFYDPTSYTGIAGITAIHVQGLQVDHVFVSDPADTTFTGIETSNVAQAIIHDVVLLLENSTVSTYQPFFLFLENTTDSVFSKVMNINQRFRLEERYWGLGQDVIVYGEVRNVTFKDCVFQNNQYGFEGYQGVLQDVKLINCTFYEHFRAIAFWDMIQIHDLVISNCTFMYISDFEAIRFSEPDKFMNVTNVRIEYNFFFSTTIKYSDVAFYSGTNMTIYRNTFFDRDGGTVKSRVISVPWAIRHIDENYYAKLYGEDHDGDGFFDPGTYANPEILDENRVSAKPWVKHARNGIVMLFPQFKKPGYDGQVFKDHVDIRWLPMVDNNGGEYVYNVFAHDLDANQTILLASDYEKNWFSWVPKEKVNGKFQIILDVYERTQGSLVLITEVSSHWFKLSMATQDTTVTTTSSAAWHVETNETGTFTSPPDIEELDFPWPTVLSGIAWLIVVRGVIVKKKRIGE